MQKTLPQGESEIDLLQSLSLKKALASSDFIRIMGVFLSLHDKEKKAYSLSENVAKMLCNQISHLNVSSKQSEEDVEIDRNRLAVCRRFFDWLISSNQQHRTTASDKAVPDHLGESVALLEKYSFPTYLFQFWKKLSKVTRPSFLQIEIFLDLLGLINSLCASGDKFKISCGKLFLLPLLDWLEASCQPIAAIFVATAQLISVLIWKSPFNYSLIEPELSTRLINIFQLIAKCNDFQLQIELIEIFWRIGKTKNFQFKNISESTRSLFEQIEAPSFLPFSNIAFTINHEQNNPNLFSAFCKEITLKGDDQQDFTHLRDIFVHFGESNFQFWVGDYIILPYDQIEWKKFATSLQIKYGSDEFTFSFDTPNFETLMKQRFPKAKFLTSSIKTSVSETLIIYDQAEGEGQVQPIRKMDSQEGFEFLFNTINKEEMVPLSKQLSKNCKLLQTSVRESKVSFFNRKRQLQEISASLTEQTRKLKHIMSEMDIQGEVIQNQAKVLQTIVDTSSHISNLL